jgi:hypothetical protein
MNSLGHPLLIKRGAANRIGVADADRRSMGDVTEHRDDQWLDG